MHFIVDSSRCTQDGICALVCPAQIINGKAGALPSMTPGAEASCIQCGQCMAFCPADACIAPGFAKGTDNGDIPPVREPLDKKKLPTAEQMEELIHFRRSIRTYSPRTVTPELLERLVSLTRFAPTAKNTRVLRWVVLQDRDAVTALVAKAVAWMEALPETDPPLAAVFPGPRLVKAWRNGVDLIARGAPQLAIVLSPQYGWETTDAAIALTYLELAAASHGIGACWGGYITTALRHPAGDAVRAHLGVAPEESVVGAQMLGYPRFKPCARPVRPQPHITWK